MYEVSCLYVHVDACVLSAVCSKVCVWCRGGGGGMLYGCALDIPVIGHPSDWTSDLAYEIQKRMFCFHCVWMLISDCHISWTQEPVL